jgi:cytochrome c oxidase subunit 2
VKGPVARTQLDVFYTTVWVTAVIFVIVASVLAYAILKFRARSEEDEHAAPPPQSHGNPLIELSLIAASVFALVIIAIPTLRAIWFTYEVPAADQANAYEVNATAYQWWFRFEYPKEEIELPNGGGKSTLLVGNELVIPAGRPVHINLRTADVIHSFWVPKLAGKVDLIPNRGNHIWMKADEPGYFWGQCAEYCGESHAVMRFRVIALGEKEFAEWLTNQKKPGRVVQAPAVAAGDQPKAQFASYKYVEVRRNSPGYSEKFDADPMGNWVQQQFPDKQEDPALIARGRKLFVEKTCAGCHTVRGHEGVGITGPDLTHVGARTTIAAGLLENNEQNLHRWITSPNDVKPGNKMWNGGYNVRDGDQWKQQFRVNDEEAHALVAYLRSLK